MMSNHGNRITQGQFSFLPDLTDEQITLQIKYALQNGWAVNVEYTDDPHPRNTYWEMFGMPMFDLKDPAGILMEINECRKTFVVGALVYNETMQAEEKDPYYHGLAWSLTHRIEFRIVRVRKRKFLSFQDSQRIAECHVPGSVDRPA